MYADEHMQWCEGDLCGIWRHSDNMSTSNLFISADTDTFELIPTDTDIVPSYCVLLSKNKTMSSGQTLLTGDAGQCWSDISISRYLPFFTNILSRWTVNGKRVYAYRAFLVFDHLNLLHTTVYTEQVHYPTAPPTSHNQNQSMWDEQASGFRFSFVTGVSQYNFYTHPIWYQYYSREYRSDTISAWIKQTFSPYFVAGT